MLTRNEFTRALYISLYRYRWNEGPRRQFSMDWLTSLRRHRTYRRRLLTSPGTPASHGRPLAGTTQRPRGTCYLHDKIHLGAIWSSNSTVQRVTSALLRRGGKCCSSNATAGPQMACDTWMSCCVLSCEWGRMDPNQTVEGVPRAHKTPHRRPVNERATSQRL